MINFDKELDQIIKTNVEENKKSKLLLHSCCAPCSTWCIERLLLGFDITVYYYNPNLDSEEEYLLRSTEQKKYCDKIGVKAIIEPYRNDDFLKIVHGLENEIEGGARCEKCFDLRLKRTAETAEKLGCEFFATTLTVSPKKNATLINGVGERVAKNYSVKYLPTDFKKNNGYLNSVKISSENKMYRQNYCGCVYSKTNRGI